MNQSERLPNPAENTKGSPSVGEYVLIAAMVIFAVAALGVSTSFELATVFATSLGALLALAAASARLLAPPSDQLQSQPQTEARLLRPTSKTAG